VQPISKILLQLSLLAALNPTTRYLLASPRRKQTNIPATTEYTVDNRLLFYSVSSIAVHHGRLGATQREAVSV